MMQDVHVAISESVFVVLILSPAFHYSDFIGVPEDFHIETEYLDPA